MDAGGLYGVAGGLFSVSSIGGVSLGSCLCFLVLISGFTPKIIWGGHLAEAIVVPVH